MKPRNKWMEKEGLINAEHSRHIAVNKSIMLDQV